MTVDPIAADAFDAMAEEYERGRPGWPADAIASLLERFGARTVLDLAAGTGKLTEILVAHAGEVVAVEPLDGMRRVLEARLPSVRALAGTAEAIPLADGSVDAVFVGEAFHWFDLRRAPAEIARVLRPGGGLAVMWNVAADDGEPWFDELVALVIEHRTEGSGQRRQDTVDWREALDAEPRLGPLGDEEVAARAADRPRPDRRPDRLVQLDRRPARRPSRGRARRGPGACSSATASTT